MYGTVFNGEQLTPETIEKTKEHFVDIYKKCIAQAKTGEMKVNDLESYIVWQEKNIAAIFEPKDSYSFTFVQRAYWLQTGQMIALLP